MALILHYMLYAFHRFGINRGERYNRWRALLFFGVLQTWLLLIVVCWISILLKNNLFFSTPIKWAIFLALITFSFAGDYFWINQEKYETIFNQWSKKKRRAWDVVVTLFALFAFSFMLYSANKVSELEDTDLQIKKSNEPTRQP